MWIYENKFACIDYICSHCLDKLYIPPPNLYLPHIDADLEDSRIKTNHKKVKTNNKDFYYMILGSMQLNCKNL